MCDEDEGFDFIYCNFPPDPVVIEEVNGKITCDLTSYDPPPQFPSNITSHVALQVLKLFIDEFYFIPKELGNMYNLEHLVLCHCQSDNIHEARITKIPNSLKNLKKLKILDLRNTLLQTFPQQLTELLSLEELYLSNCQLSSLPDSLANLHELKTLDLSNNILKIFPSCILKLHNLHILYLSDVHLQSLSEEVKKLINLERLQLTNNEISVLPEGLFELVNLRKLYLNGNKLTSLHEKVGDLVNLEYLVLNQNKLTKIPDSIGKLKELRYLNLHENMLSSLPESIISLEQIETVLVDNNPLQVPPVHVCNQGIQSIRNYFQAMNYTSSIHSKRLKVLVLGESMAGKTSLVHALVKGQSSQIEENDRTFGVDLHHWKPEPHVDELELMVVDCAGQRKYHMTHQLFLSEGALFILAVKLSRYNSDSPESYQENVGQWISFVAARIPRARILVVPTHIDECLNPEEIDFKCRNILLSIKEQQQEMVHKIEKKSKHVEKTEHSYIPPDELAKKLERHQEQKDNLPVISLQYKLRHIIRTIVEREKNINLEQVYVNHGGESTPAEHGSTPIVLPSPTSRRMKRKKEDNLNGSDNLAMNVTPVSNTTLEGMLCLREELVRIARNKNLCPNIDIKLPESWVDIEKQIKGLRKTEDIPCLSIAELQLILSKQNITVSESDLRSCVSYLEAIGELNYFKDIQGLVKNVIINPYWLGSVLKKIFRHDMNENLTYNNSVRNMDVVLFQFKQDKKQLLDNGVMTQWLLKCLWSEFLDESDTIFPQLLTMLTHFGLACEMPSVGNNLDAVDGTPPAVRYLVPWFFKPNRPESLDKNWPLRSNAGQIEVTAGFALCQYLPFGVFERFSVLSHKHEPDDYEHWQNGFYMKFDEVLIYSNVRSVQKCHALRVAARAPKGQLNTLWRTLLILLEEIEKLLKEWPGMIYIQFTLCPGCIQNGISEPYHFPCNWFKTSRASKRKAICSNKVDGQKHEVQLDHLCPSKDVLDGYKNPVVTYPNEIPDCVLSDGLLDGIADRLGTNWPQLARKLGLSMKVPSIKDDNRGNIHEQAVEVLTKWKSREGQSAKIEVIIKALRESELNDIADFILTKSRAIENSTTPN